MRVTGCFNFRHFHCPYYHYHLLHLLLHWIMYLLEHFLHESVLILNGSRLISSSYLTNKTLLPVVFFTIFLTLLYSTGISILQLTCKMFQNVCHFINDLAEFGLVGCVHFRQCLQIWWDRHNSNGFISTTIFFFHCKNYIKT